MSKMAEVHKEVADRVRNSYSMIDDCLETVFENWDGSGTELHLNSDQASKLKDNLDYVWEVFLNDILPWLGIKTDDTGLLIEEE